MKISFESDLLVPPISKVISILTDKAKVCIEDIHFDDTNRIVEIYIQRKEITGFKKSFLGEVRPVYGQNTNKALLRIRQVEEIQLQIDDRLATECNSCFTILFGLKVDNNLLHLGSAEEIQGVTLGQIFIKVKKLSIEYRDEMEIIG